NNKSWKDWFQAFYLNPSNDQRILDAVEQAQEEISQSLIRQAEQTQNEIHQQLAQEAQEAQSQEIEKNPQSDRLRESLYRLAEEAEANDYMLEEIPDIDSIFDSDLIRTRNEEFRSLLEKTLQEELVELRTEQSKRLQADQFSLNIAQQIRQELEAEKKKDRLEKRRKEREEQIEERQIRRAERRQEREEQLARIRASIAQEIALSRLSAGEERANQEIEKEREKVQETLSRVSLFQNTDGALQRGWYRFTDQIAQYSIPTASKMDSFKEWFEEEIQSRRATAFRARERQKREQQRALEEQRQKEHQNRIRRLELLRKREEERALEYERQQILRIEQAEEKERKEYVRTLEVEKRHIYHRDPKTQARAERQDRRGADLRGYQFTAVNWSGSQLSQSQMSGIRFEYASLVKADLRQSDLTGARLNETTLDGALLEKSILTGVSLRKSSLIGAQMRLTRILDADLRELDCTGAALPSCDISGSDASQAIFAGANLRDALFTGTNLQNASFRSANLIGASFHQAILKDVDLRGAEVEGADFSGSYGLTPDQLQSLISRGARIDDASSMQNPMGISQLRAAVFLFALGLGTYLFTSYITSQETDIVAMEEEIKALSLEDPTLASERYESLATQSVRIDDKVGYLIEAASLAEQVRKIERSESLLQQALTEADEDEELRTKVLLQLSAFYSARKQYDKTLELTTKLIQAENLSASERARLTLLIEEAAAILDEDPSDRLRPLYTFLETSPSIEADFRIAMAEARTEAGNPIAALKDIDRAEQLELPAETQLRLIETRARVQERGGDYTGAIQTLKILRDRSDKNSLAWQSALLTMADIHQREDEPDDAIAILNTLLNAQMDGRLKGRAYLVEGRVYENQDDITKAAESYQKAISLPEVEPETQEEARLSLARMLLEKGDTEAAKLLVNLPPTALAQAKLGEARRFIDDNQPNDSLRIYNELIEDDQLDDTIHRAAKAGAAEVLAAMGNFSEAEQLWRSLLALDIPPAERSHIEVLLAYGMMQSGDVTVAQEAFLSLSQSKDPEIRIQGLLGLAEAARNLGERERAKTFYRQVIDESEDDAFDIQAWRELALIASEQEKPEDVLTAWRSIRQYSTTDSSLMADATLSIATALKDLGRIDEAIEMCSTQTLSAEASLNCASIMIDIDTQKALALYKSVAENPETQRSLRAEGALGAASISSDSQWLSLGLEQVENDPGTELKLLSLALSHEAFLSQRDTLQERRNRLSQESPLLLAQSLVASAHKLRSQNRLKDAIQEMNQAQELPLAPAEKEPIQLELADLYLENNQLDDAIALYETLQQSQDEQRRFDSQIGLANALFRNNEMSKAVDILETSQPPNANGEQQKTEILAQLLTAQEEPEALQLWDRYASTDQDNPETQYTALSGQAQIQLGSDQPKEALALYQAAASLDVEPTQISWAHLGMANAYFEMQQNDDALSLLRTEQKSSNPEIATQAYIRIAQFHLAQEEPSLALETVKDFSAQPLGPAWDATLEETRAAAYSAQDEPQKAIEVLESLAQRWPEDEEAQLPAWLGLADLHRSIGERDRALSYAEKAKNRAQDPNYKDRAISFIAAMKN
ncbi:MAG: pentapeptide repeat-containing protein, partial [Myxococcota bacterium]|nr:pentapeptide repeat-containing protein [Myxococcota bacterium]